MNTKNFTSCLTKRRKMKKINSYWGGRLTVIVLFSLSLLTSILCIYGIVSDSLWWIFFIPLSFLMLYAAICCIKKGFLSYLKTDEFKICNANYSINWNNVYITLSSTRDIVYGNGLVYIVYIDDHYLTEDEINNKTNKMFMVVNLLIPKRHEQILLRYDKKVKIIAQNNDKRLKTFLEHNSKYN